MTLDNKPPRITSMDQFRGYTVFGMLLVNYISEMDAFHDVLKHHGTYFSYADSIMPSFFFAVGYSFRLTILRRLPQFGWASTSWTYLRRSVALVFISLLFAGLGDPNKFGFDDWNNYSWQAAWHLVTRIIKADLWETLALIGVTQMFLLPFISRSTKFRAFAIVGCIAAHALLGYLFNFNFQHQQPNALEDLLVKYIDWGATGKRSWESGPFGVLGWSVAMLSGSIAYDVVMANVSASAVRKLLALGALFMAVGYSISCLTRLYDVEKGEGADAASVKTPEWGSAEWAAPPRDLNKFAVSPVCPPLERIKGQSVRSLLAEPPFTPPPDVDVRRKNYWMMTKQLPSPAFILFASGFAFALYALFVLACDIGPLRIGVFRTFGQNPLVTYLLHYIVMKPLLAVSPNNAPLWYCLASVAAFYLVVYAIVRNLEKQGIFVRL